MYKLEDIAKECGVQKDAILAFIKYRIEYNMPVPQPEPYQSSKYVYSDESAKEIIELFKNTHKELAESLPKVDDIADAYYMSCYAKKLCEEDQ